MQCGVHPDRDLAPRIVIRRTIRGPVLNIPIRFPVRLPEPKLRKTYRKPAIFAMKLLDLMATEGFNRAEMARRLGVSRARVTQWLDLLELPQEVIRLVEAKRRSAR